MFIKRLILNHFRNYEHIETSFGQDRIFLTGENGIGKTNIIEAIYYLTLGRSFRKADDSSLIQKNQKEASIYLEFFSEEDNRDHSLSCVIGKDGKTFAFDDEKVKSISSIFGKLLAIYYEPSLVFFFKNEPEQRRRMMDENCSHLSQAYFFALGRYKKLLKERNVALQQNYDSDVIDSYRNQLINLSYRIIQERKAFVKEISKKSSRYYEQLFKENEKNFTLSYRTSCPLDDDQESFVKNSIQLFEKNKSLENMRKTTIIGPHRDDLTGYLNSNPIAAYGSQGENRIASLSLRLSLVDILKEKLSLTPILLLDDVTSDLDEKRCQNLLACINKEDMQVFVTGTRIPNGFSDYQIYTSNGSSLMKGE